MLRHVEHQKIEIQPHNAAADRLFPAKSVFRRCQTPENKNSSRKREKNQKKCEILIFPSFLLIREKSKYRVQSKFFSVKEKR